MKHLNLSPDLNFPPDIVTRKTVVYGGNGMGKSNLTAGVIPEELHRLGLRFCFLDLMGIGWGLQHGAKRGEKGLDVLILGGPHGDIEIEPTAGAVVADLVADETISTVIDYSRTKAGKGWSKGEKIRFTADFYLRLHERQAETRRPLLVIQDEASRVIPQMIPHGSPDLARCVGAIETMAEEGRNIGVGIVFVTPRSARMNKSVSELADTMIAFRTVGPNSVDAVMDWLGEHIEKERHKAIVGQLRTLPVGSALVVSPGWLNHEGVVRFRMRQTFDSSKTPEVGMDHHAPTAATKPDLEKYQERMKATIQKAKAEDPKELRRQIAELQRKVAEADRTGFRRGIEKAPMQVEKIVEVPALKGGEIDRLGKLIDRIEKHIAKVEAAGHEAHGLMDQIVKAIAPQTIRHTSQEAVASFASKYPLQGFACKGPMLPPKTMTEPPRTSEVLTPAKQRIIDALGQLGAWNLLPGKKAQVAFLAAASPNSGSFNNNLGSLRSAGLIDYPTHGFITLTEAGRAVCNPSAVPATSEAMQAAVLAKLEPAKQRILSALLSVYPQSLSKDALAAQAQASPNSGSFNNNLGALRSLGVIDYPQKGMVVATDAMFLEARD